jgi:hypothetical protein
MVQSQRPNPINVGGVAPFNAQAFFEALPSNRESALSMLRAQVPDDGPPTPRAATFIESGEWDSSTLIPIVFIAIDPCVGQVGIVAKGEGVRFCGLRLGDCSSRTHVGFVWVEFRPGWFIPGGTRNGSGYYRSPSLPSAELGGPITSSIAKVLRDPNDPVVLSLGQWKFVIEEWVVGAVATTPSSGEFSFETESGPQGPKSESGSPTDDTISDSNEAEKNVKAKMSPVGPGGASEPKMESEEPKSTTSKGKAGPTADAIDSSDSDEDRQSSRKESSDKSKLTGLLMEFRVLQGKVDIMSSDAGKAKAQNLHLLQRIADLEGEIKKKSTWSPDEVLHRVRGLETRETIMASDLGRLLISVYDPLGELNLIHEQVAALRSMTKVGSGVERHGMTFTHPSEIAPVLRVIRGSIGIFHDVVSLLHSIGATTASHKTTLSMMKAQRDVKIGTDLEARVITSFRTNLPAILYGGSTTIDAIDDYVSLGSKLKDYKAWHHPDGVSGVSQRMLRGAVEIQQRVGFLANQLTTDPKVLRLSGGLMIDSVNFVQRFVSFINTTYINYKLTSYFEDDENWDVLLAYIERMFEDLRSARCLIQDASESEPAVLLWGILKSHEVMDTYLKHDFKNHPSFNSILVQRMLKSSPTADVHSKMTTLEKGASTTNSSIIGLKTRVSTLENKVGKS